MPLDTILKAFGLHDLVDFTAEFIDALRTSPLARTANFMTLLITFAILIIIPFSSLLIKT